MLAEIPCPDGLAYLPYQVDCIHFCLPRKGTLVADSPGLGKTVEAIGLANALPSCSVLIICPATLKVNWANEWQKWDVHHRLVGFAGDTFPRSDVVIINYQILRKWRGQIRERAWGLLIVDEAHNIINPDAQRAQEIFGCKASNKKGREAIAPIVAQHEVFLTGTPMVNRPADLWNFCKRLDPEGMGRDQWRFWNDFCDLKPGRYGIDVSGAKNMPELNRRLKAFMIRRKKEDVLPQLPPKRRQIIEIPADGCKAVVEDELLTAAKVEADIAEQRAAVERARHLGDREYREAVKKLRDVRGVGFTEMARVRKAVGIAKVPFIIERLHSLIEESGKVVLFIHHKDVMNAIMSEFGMQAVKIDGRITDIHERQAAVNRFQKDSACTLFAGSDEAASEGITLTAAYIAVTGEQPWNPKTVTQCEDRIHRITQVSPVLIQHLVFEGSLDVRMIKKCVAKQEIMDAALDGAVDQAALARVDDDSEVYKIVTEGEGTE